MAKDTLYEESRIIRKAVEEGKSTEQIMEMLSLSENQVKYRIETRYSALIAKKILIKLNENDNEALENQEEKNEPEKEKSLVVDTTSLEKNGAIKFIMSHSKIILLDDIILELAKKTNNSEIFEKNKQELLKESAEDKDGKKIQVEITKKNNCSTVQKVLDFCKGKDVILYTADNGMATLARCYGIEYILATDIEENENIVESEPEREETKNQEAEIELENQEAVNIDIENLVKNMRDNSISEEQISINKSTIVNVNMIGKDLVLNIPMTHKIRYIVLSGDEIKKPIIGCNSIKLKTGDMVIVMTYKKMNKVLSISKYEITDIKSEEHAIYIGSNKINHINEIEKLGDLPKEAKKDVRNYFTLVKSA